MNHASEIAGRLRRTRQALAKLLRLLDIEHPSYPCACVEDDCRFPPPCAPCRARQVLAIDEWGTNQKRQMAGVARTLRSMAKGPIPPHYADTCSEIADLLDRLLGEAR